MRPTYHLDTLLTSLALLAGLGLLILVYQPGLAGAFVFDDLINLNALGRYGGVTDRASFLLYLTSGIADATGRPLSTLSFLIDDMTWPSESSGFKRTNLAIHALNSLLLAWLLIRLSARAGLSIHHGQRAAVLAALLWALHPLWVSTTLYVVQRHAMLPALFVLVGLLCWDAAWRRLELGGPRAAWLFGFVGLGLASLLAALSKPNGALLPALAATLWWLFYRRHTTALPAISQHAGRWLPRAALLAPASAVLLALMLALPGFIDTAASSRPWTLGERILSQPRALWEYLGLLVLPREGSAGLFADDFVVSTGLLTPWTTLPAVLGLIALATLAVRLRRRQPIAAAAVLFFLVGHSVESSITPLEPYFEHRNYLPALLLFWPLAVWLTQLAQTPSGQAQSAQADRSLVRPDRTPARRDRLRHLRLGLIVILPLLLAGLTWSRAVVWGDLPKLMVLFAERSPESPRAQQSLARLHTLAGDHELARERLLRGLSARPDDALLALTLVTVECRLGGVGPEALATATRAFATLPAWTSVMYGWLTEKIEQARRGDCAGLNLDDLAGMLAAAAANPRVANQPGWLQDVLGLQGQLTLARGDIDTAETLMRQSLALEPRPDMALWQAAQFGTYDQPGLGLAHLRHYRECCTDAPIADEGMARLHTWLKWRLGHYPRELDHLESMLRAEVAAQTERRRPDTADGPDTRSHGDRPEPSTR